MTILLALALALTPAAPAPSPNVSVGDLGSRQFTLGSVRLEPRKDGASALRGWLCRRAPGPAVRRLWVVAEGADGREVWSRRVDAPRFDAGAPRQCRVLKVEVPPQVVDEAAVWRVGRGR